MVKEEKSEHRPIYYINKVLQGAEAKYLTIEKFSFIVITRKMKPYF